MFPTETQLRYIAAAAFLGIGLYLKADINLVFGMVAGILFPTKQTLEVLKNGNSN